MDVQFYGANCIALTYKGTRVVVDDNLADLGGKPVLKGDDIALFTGERGDVRAAVKLLVDHPGEYEVADVAIVGAAARAHMDADEKGRTATMYKITAGDVNALAVGHVYPELSEDQLEELGRVDVMIVPVGGNGYTLDAIGALKLIKAVEPKLVIPTHYAEKGINYPVPQQELDIALKELGMEPRERTTKLKIKPGDFGETTQLVVLEKQ